MSDFRLFFSDINCKLNSFKMPDENDNHRGNEPVVDINALIVKLPTFWSSNPRTWFLQAEAQFTLGKITADVSKYNYVVATLPQEIAESVSDILENPPNTGLYDNLKSNLIDRHTLSLESRIKKLVSDEEMGDKKPSDYYRTLRRLAGSNNAVGDELLKKLWMSRLPQAVGVALIPQKDDEIDKLMKLADQVWEAIKTANISAVSSNSSTSNDGLRGEINELKAMIEKLTFDRSRNRSRNRSRSYSRSNNNNDNNNRSRQRSRSRSSRFDPNGKFCYYHFKFGNKASKPCNKPCSFKSAQSSSNNSNSNNNPN